MHRQTMIDPIQQLAEQLEEELVKKEETEPSESSFDSWEYKR